MNRCTLKMLLRSIRRSLGRYLAILGIVALGACFRARCGILIMMNLIAVRTRYNAVSERLLVLSRNTSLRAVLFRNRYVVSTAGNLVRRRVRVPR